MPNEMKLGRAQFEDEAALAELYDELMGMLTEPSATKKTMVADYVRLEKLKLLAMIEVEKRGVGFLESNGRQRYYKDTKAAALIPKYMEQQAKLLKKLGIDGGDDAAADENVETDGFDDI